MAMPPLLLEPSDTQFHVSVGHLFLEQMRRFNIIISTSWTVQTDNSFQIVGHSVTDAAPNL